MASVFFLSSYKISGKRKKEADKGRKREIERIKMIQPNLRMTDISASFLCKIYSPLKQEREWDERKCERERESDEIKANPTRIENERDEIEVNLSEISNLITQLRDVTVALFVL